MFRASLAGWNEKRLRLWLVVFFLAVAIPTGILIRQAYSQLKWEAFHRHRVMAEELTTRIDRRLGELIDAEEARAFTDYAFLVVAGDPAASFVQRSPLSAYPLAAAIPGLIGYFQIDAQGQFTTPLLPQPGVQPLAYGISSRELDQRRTLQDRIQQILGQNRLVDATGTGVVGGKQSLPHAPPRNAADKPAVATYHAGKDVARSRVLESEQLAPQAAFDRLNEGDNKQQRKKQKLPRALGRVEDLQLDPRYQRGARDDVASTATQETAAPAEKRVLRKERSALPEQKLAMLDEVMAREAAAESGLRIRIFESEIDAFAFNVLDSGHFVLFRKVWRDGQRYIQGSLIEPQAFFRGVIESAFRPTALSQVTDLAVAFAGDVLSAFSGQASREYLSSTEELQGALLYQTRLSAPLNNLALIFSVTHLPAGPGSTVVTWVAAILLLVLCGGFYLMYRLGVGQIKLTRQQQDFVSAVSHELKTPLTSIRMYGEILREGWADEEKKKTYYEYIHDESERLSRLIANVLQLARMTRNDSNIDLKPMPVMKLMDNLRSKVSSQIERAGFKLNMTCEDDAGQAVIDVDADYFAQIVINLVDNATKFSAKADRRAIDIACRRQRDGTLQFSVRDYGPGVPKDQMKKIFALFYRSENELTRETVGTGIGLALVHQLALAMRGRVDVVNRDPGAEFRVSFAARDSLAVSSA